jgi:alpha-ketoglutaric semialdehyde dehydrogenase
MISIGQTVPELSSFVAGGWRTNGRMNQDTNPARPSEVVAMVHLADSQDVQDAIDAAKWRMRDWRTTPAPVRGDILRRAADFLDARANAIAVEFSREEGKTVAEALGETKRAASILRYFSGQTLEPDGETYPSQSATTMLFARREPVGVVAAITPWNFPMGIAAWKIAPALAFGNTVVWKPAELVPLTSVRFFEALRDAGLPDGVLGMILGRSSEVGEPLVSHPDVDAITFTGSNAVGRRIQSQAVSEGKRVQLELGGKNPVIVLADANLSHAADQVARGAFLSAGQKCTATSRVIVERSVLQEFTDQLLELATSWKLGDPLDPLTKVGPLAGPDRLASVERFFEHDRLGESRVLCGGTKAPELGEGYYFRPTVLATTNPNTPIARDEIFGPVTAVMPASDFDEAISLANDTPFGLSASLFTNDLGRALVFAKEMRAGVVKINQETAGTEPQVPFGGMKQSSSGSREQGKTAREFFTEWKTVYIDEPPAKNP